MILRMAFREILHRRVSFLAGFLSVAAAAGCLAGAMALLSGHDRRTEELLSERESVVRQAGDALEEEMRKITKGLGFNILILDARQDIAELELEGVASTFLPEEYAERLAKSGTILINHILPSLTQKTEWTEKGRKEVILFGTRGEVPVSKADPRKPIQPAVPPGILIPGYEVALALHLKKGEKVDFRGQPFMVGAPLPEKGSKDDVTVFVDLKAAQEILGKQNLVSAILAIECKCADKRLAEIRRVIGEILPGTQVREYGPQALARAEARTQAAKSAEEALEEAKNSRAALRREREGFASVLVPVVLASTALWVAFLAFGNVRERRHEIGILRAMGVSSRGVLFLFLGRSVLMGVLGGVAGIAAGPWLGALLGGEGGAVDGWMLAGIVIGSPVVAALAGWVPAVLASRQDPAVILRGD